MTERVCVYMDSRIHGILKKISDKEKIGMSTILRVAFIDKFAKFYPDLFSIQDKKNEIKKCDFRACEKTEECGGAVYWWCLKKQHQINVYEDCKECVPE